MLEYIRLRWRRREKAVDETKQWCRDAQGLVARLQQAAYQTTTYQPADYETLRQKLDTLATEIQEHASSAPSSIPSEMREDLVQLAAFSSGIIPLTESNEEEGGGEVVERV